MATRRKPLESEKIAKATQVGNAAAKEAKTKSRVAVGLPENIDAPKPARAGRSSAVKTDTIKRTPSARANQRRAQKPVEKAPDAGVDRLIPAEEQMGPLTGKRGTPRPGNARDRRAHLEDVAATTAVKTKQAGAFANDYIGPRDAHVKEIVPTWLSPADKETKLFNTPYSKAYKIVDGISKTLGEGASNLPAGVSDDFRNDIAARMTSVHTSHSLAYQAAAQGDPIKSLQFANDAHETLQSIGHMLNTHPEVRKSRAFSVARDVLQPIGRHADVIRKATTDQRKNMSIETTSPDWDRAGKMMSGLADEPKLRPRRRQDFATPDTRNPRRGRSVFPSVVSFVNVARNHTADPNLLGHADEALRTARGFGDAVEAGDTTASRNLGTALLGHMQALHNGVRNSIHEQYVGNRRTNLANPQPHLVNLYTKNLAQHHDNAAFGINEILGEK